MKRKLLLLLTFLAYPLFAQHHTASFKLGSFSPHAAEAGFIIGYEGGKFIDENFQFGWSVDWYHINYVDKRLVDAFNDYYGIINSEINELRAKTNLHSIPLMVTVTGNIPITYRTKAFFTGGAGLEVLLIFYKNFQNTDENNFHGAFDFNWRVSGGLLYEVGRRSDIFGELSYHSSHPGWQYEVSDLSGRRTFERSFDMSGFMFRVGFRFYM